MVGLKVSYRTCKVSVYKTTYWHSYVFGNKLNEFYGSIPKNYVIKTSKKEMKMK